MQILFTKYVVSETIQSILELLKHFEVVSETSVIRNNNGNFGVDFLKSLPGAKQQLKHTDFKNNGINSTGSSIIINFENFSLGLYLWVNEKKTFVTINAQSFIYFKGKVEHCGTENNTEFEINKFFFYIDDNKNVRKQASVFDKVFFSCTNNKNKATNNLESQNVVGATSNLITVQDTFDDVSSDRQLSNITSIPMTAVSTQSMVTIMDNSTRSELHINSNRESEVSRSEQHINSNRASKRLLNRNLTNDQNIITPNNVTTVIHTKKQKLNDTRSGASTNTTKKITKSITPIDNITKLKNTIKQLKLEHATSYENNLKLFNTKIKNNLAKLDTLRKENKDYKKITIELKEALEKNATIRRLNCHLNIQLENMKNELIETKKKLANKQTNNEEDQFINANNKQTMADYDTIKNENIKYKKQIESVEKELNKLKSTIKTNAISEQKQVNIIVDSKSEKKTQLSATLKRIEELEEKLHKESDEESDDFDMNRKNIEKINIKQYEK
jgi:hypothetical protein